MKGHAMTPAEIGTAIVAGVTLGWRIYDGIREKSLTRKYKLLDNPDRCMKHEVALAEIRLDVVNIKEDIRDIKDKIEDL
jgi:hypothetical protein